MVTIRKVIFLFYTDNTQSIESTHPDTWATASQLRLSKALTVVWRPKKQYQLDPEGDSLGS